LTTVDPAEILLNRGENLVGPVQFQTAERVVLDVQVLTVLELLQSAEVVDVRLEESVALHFLAVPLDLL
jgi:hypothetical protein